MANKQIPELDEATQLDTGDFFPFRKTSVNVDQRLSWSTMIGNMTTRQPENWLAKVASIQESVAASPTVLAYFGDSWIQNSIITIRLREILQALYGDAGGGYVGIGNNSGSGNLSLTYTRGGTWVDSGNTGRGADISEATSTDVSTPAKVTITGTVNTAVIHYLKQSGGGDFRWRVDSGSWTTVATANAGDLYATETISGLSTSSHTVEIEVSSAGSVGVTLFGVDFQKSGNGVRVHRFGRGGASASQFAAVNAQLWQAAVASVSPTICLVMLGTNDQSGSVSLITYGGHIDTMLQRIRIAAPLCDIILTPSSDNGLTGKAYPVIAYRNEMRNAAIRNNCTYIDTYTPIGSYADGNARGMYANSSHLNAAGSRVVVNTILKYLSVA